MNKTFHVKANAWYKVGVYELGLHCLFVAVLLQFSSSVSAAYLLRVLLIGVTALFLWGSIRGRTRRWSSVCVPISVQVGALVMLLAGTAILLAAAQYDGSVFSKIATFSPYVWALVALGGVDEEEWSGVKKALRLHALVGTLVFLGLLVQSPSLNYVNRASFLGDSDKTSPIVLCRELMYSYPILLILLPEEGWVWRCAGAASTLGMAAWAILGQFRSTLVLGVGLTIVFSLCCWQRAKSVRWSKRLTAVLVVVMCVALGWLLLDLGGLTVAEGLRTAWSQTLERLTDSQEAESSSGLENIRFAEAGYYLKDLTLDRLLMGDHGDWKSPSGLEMHVGHLRYIIYGGLPTLMAFWILLYWQGWKCALTSRKLSVLAAAGVVAMHSVQAIPAGMLGLVPHSAVLFICAGYCWHSTAAKRPTRGARLRQSEALPSQK